MRERDFWCLVCFATLLLSLCYFCVLVLGQSGIWADDFTLVSMPLTHSFPSVLRGLGGCSVQIALIPYLGFVLWEVLEDYQKKGGELMPLCSPSPDHSPFLHCCQAGWGCVPCLFPVTQRGGRDFLLLLPHRLHHPLLTSFLTLVPPR